MLTSHHVTRIVPFPPSPPRLSHGGCERPERTRSWVLLMVWVCDLHLAISKRTCEQRWQGLLHETPRGPFARFYHWRPFLGFYKGLRINVTYIYTRDNKILMPFESFKNDSFSNWRSSLRGYYSTVNLLPFFRMVNGLDKWHCHGSLWNLVGQYPIQQPKRCTSCCKKKNTLANKPWIRSFSSVVEVIKRASLPLPPLKIWP